MTALTIGFDLDMTLIDSRPGIKAVYDELAHQTGVPIDSALVITAKKAALAQLHLDHLGLKADSVHGHVWRLAKAEVLTERGAQFYVGDHVHDMDAAIAAKVRGIGVTTGPSTTAELQDHGAEVVLDSLLELPELLEKVSF